MGVYHDVISCYPSDDMEAAWPHALKADLWRTTH